jgi:hypothetical protein
MFLNDKEKDAISRKMKKPKAEVKCPRCGELLNYEETPSSISVWCPTKGCIFGGLRGI